jgi:NAD(P)-dependent dehydrogenase (short-subunit alcohol dehydrogenase family)
MARTLPLTGQSALVTGGGAGLGIAIAEAMGAAGAAVMVIDIDANQSQRAAEKLRANGVDARAIQGSVAVSEDVERVFAAFDES